jgi:integrase
MGVFRKQGVYWVDYYVDGHRKRERIGPDKRLAETVLRKRKVEIAEGKYLDKQRPITTTFDELADVYVTWIKPDEDRGVPARKKSWRSHDLYALGHLRPYFGAHRLTAITPAMVAQYQAERRASLSRFGRPARPASVNRELATLRTMFNVAKRGMLGLKGGVPLENPVTSRLSFAEDNERDRVLTPDELARLIELAPDWLRPIMILAHDSGMRRGEIARLRWAQVDGKRRLITLRSGETKTNEGRVIPMTDRVYRLLDRLPRHVSGTVFVTTRGTAYHPNAISAAFQKTCIRAGMADVHFHDLRHGFATNMRRAGVDAFTIMKITGHRSLAVFQRYNNVSTEDVTRAIQRLDTYTDTSNVHGRASHQKD